MSVEAFRAEPPPRPYRFELLPEGAQALALELLEESPDRPPPGEPPHCPPPGLSPEELGAAVERGLASALEFAAVQAEEQRTALVLLTEIVDLPLAEMKRHLAGRPPLRTPELCRLLFDKSAEEAHRAPWRALEFAELAQLAAQRLDEASPANLPAAIRHDVLAEAWAVLADTRRLAGDLAGAEEALKEADRHLEEGSGTLLVRAEILLRKASLCCDLERYDKGLRCVDQALVILRAGVRRGPIARALNARGRLCLESGAAGEALPLFEEALELSDGSRDRALELATRHNLAACLVELDRPDEARRPLADAQALARLLARPLAGLRLRWLEGRLAWCEDDPLAAGVAFTEAREGFRAAGSTFEATRVGLDLEAIDALRRRRRRRLIAWLTAPESSGSAPVARPPADRSW